MGGYGGKIACRYNVRGAVYGDSYHSLIRMFVHCCGIDRAIAVWRELLSIVNVPQYTFIIKICIESGKNLRAFELYDELRNQHTHLQPDSVMFITLLKACGSDELLIRELHRDILLSADECRNDQHVISTLISAYNACGNKAMAHELWRDGHA